MIKPFNISTSATANLYGKHYAKKVYAKNVVFHPDDVEYGILYCEDVMINGEIPAHEKLNADDRIYMGDLHCRDIIVKGKDDDQI